MRTCSFYFLLAIVSFISVEAQAQQAPKLSVAFSTGFGNYVPYDDFATTVFLREGQPDNRGNGNIAEDNMMLYAAIEFAYQLSPRFSVAPFAQYQYHDGQLFENDRYIFGVTSFNDEEKQYTFPADNELSALVIGASFRYHIIRQEKVKAHVGAGLSYLNRSHTYRELLTVNFTEASDIIDQSEEYSTKELSALGIPLTANLEFQLSKKVAVGVRLLGQVHANLEDAFWTGGVILRKSL